MKYRILFSFLFLSLLCPVFSQQLPQKSDVEKIFSSYLADSNNTGLAIGFIFRDSSKVYCFGRQRKSDTVKVISSTIFEIGSITKTFTAVLLAERVLQNKMSLEDPIDKYLPDSVKLLPEMQNKIKLLNLITHTSGLPRIQDDFVKNTTYNGRNADLHFEEKDLFNYLMNYKNSKPVGHFAYYSNLAVGLLGHLLELNSGKPYDSLVADEICKPLGMIHTIKNPSTIDSNHLARGYAKGKDVYIYDFGVLSGASSLKSTITDMLIYLNKNINTDESQISQAIELTHKKLKRFDCHSNVGMAWFIRKHKYCGRIRWHNGSFNGQRSFIAFDEKKRLGVVILTNSTDDTIDPHGFQMIKLLEKYSRKKK
jgi:serine-type D-Ala-D-Ala carboxypeptidase/endopeptidase